MNLKLEKKTTIVSSVTSSSISSGHQIPLSQSALSTSTAISDVKAKVPKFVPKIPVKKEVAANTRYDCYDDDDDDDKNVDDDVGWLWW